MIIGEQKPLEEIKQMIVPYQKVLILGCGTCVTICFAGGEKEAGILGSLLRMSARMDGQEKQITEATVQRQCEYEYNATVAGLVEEAEVVVSLACGIGIQTMNEQFPQRLTLPGLNTTFLGQPMAQGIWAERCQACGDCVLDTTGGICPIARCAKSLLNGPCGGAEGGKCEVSKDIDCAWVLIYERLKGLGQLELMEGDVVPPKDWDTSRDGGQRRIVREDLLLS